MECLQAKVGVMINALIASVQPYRMLITEVQPHLTQTRRVKVNLRAHCPAGIEARNGGRLL